MQLLNGKMAANIVKAGIKEYLFDCVIRPTLVVIQVGNDSASNTYIKNKVSACEYTGINSKVLHVEESVSEDYLISMIHELNDNPEVHGILVQLPLPKNFNVDKILSSISPYKDVDGFHYENVGRVVVGNERFVSCTPLGIMKLLQYYNIPIAGKECIVVGRSNIVGKPIALELLHANGTVTIAHSKTVNLKEVCKRADILVCAIGKPKFFNRDYVKDGAVVIDVGINRDEFGKLCGDVDFEDVKDIVSAISPVPNGVGAMTVAMLMYNCVEAMKIQSKRAKENNMKEGV